MERPLSFTLVSLNDLKFHIIWEVAVISITPYLHVASEEKSK